MRRLHVYLMALGCVIALSGCNFMDSVLSVNMFEGKVLLSEKTVAEMPVNELAAEVSSPSFIETLRGNDAMVDAVIANVDATIAENAGAKDEASVVATQQAALVGATVNLETTEAAALVDNISEVLKAALASSAPPDLKDPKELIKLLVPPAAQNDKATFVDMVNALVEANDYYKVLGQSMVASSAGAEPTYKDPSVNPGEVAQNALVAALVGAIAPPAGQTLGDYLYTLAVEPEKVTAPPKITIPDTTAGSPLGAILSAGFPVDVSKLLNPSTASK